jgi:hypothetical protein
MLLGEVDVFCGSGIDFRYTAHPGPLFTRRTAGYTKAAFTILTDGESG